ncbi:MAG: YkgJ family cysteine cluster protein, partial [Lentisphaeria bacterium]|nr:YkgJ family cysteine cluster protein [Lentisphaeria bacterium]
GKRAGEKCIHLDEKMRCRLFGKKERPAVCGALRPCEEMCRNSAGEAMEYLTRLEKETAP